MIKIMADSTCDLSQDILEKYDIGVAPLKINIDGKTYSDKIDIKTDELFELLPNIEKHPTTSMPSPTEFLSIMKEAVDKGHTSILCICMSSGTSASYQAAEIAKDTFYDENPNSEIKIHVVDSKSMSHGSGWLILKSARLRDEGASFDELVKFNEAYKKNVKHYLSVDDLDHLIRSGRLTNTSAFIGKLLKLKPIMSMKDGKGAIVAKERGRKKVLNHYVSEFLKRNNPELTDFIIIGYSNEIGVAEVLKEKLIQEAGYNGEIFIMQMGVAVSTHVGPGAISLFFIEKNRN
ncbi:DegV family protein [Desulfuribacillus alkaliarsenatis]|uniref:Fatty acid-binding protein DegV n=1 Tax=Desulfuribacillus alkaliarsenatis TaxID=766136 RepID=A0A1E5G2V6_9FIRM|nr:fatty acid-binding protein DegV [Desulfuribacillus alkaliarsenatis]